MNDWVRFCLFIYSLLLKVDGGWAEDWLRFVTATEVITHGPYIPHPDIEYRCVKCSRSNCRLYRYYNTFLDHQELFCRSCGELRFPDGAASFPFDSRRPHTLCGGSLVSAVPCEDVPTYWGYTSIPSPGVVWWNSLPQ